MLSSIGFRGGVLLRILNDQENGSIRIYQQETVSADNNSLVVLPEQFFPYRIPLLSKGDPVREES